MEYLLLPGFRMHADVFSVLDAVATCSQIPSLVPASHIRSTSSVVPFLEGMALEWRGILTVADFQ